MILQGKLILVYSLGSAIITFVFVWLLKKYNKAYKAKKKNLLLELPVAAFITGFIEIILYSFSILADMPEFIVFWLGVKTALKWDRKGKNGETADDVTQRGTYLTYLSGTGLNIILAYISASLVRGELIVF